MKFLIVLAALCATALGGTPRLDGRIVGGQHASIVEYPYQASVRIYDTHICGGSVIDENTILTAAHCVDGMDHTRYSVRVGKTNHAEGQSFIVSTVRMNKNYNPDTLDSDMAILKLSSSINFSSYVSPIELQNEGESVPARTVAWVSGWGALFEGSSVTPEELRAVDVSVITNQDCQAKYPNEKITSNMMCAQTLNHDSCQGDSGGPLMANDKLVGVVSWGYGCARPQYPGVYASVANMYSWIQENRN